MYNKSKIRKTAPVTEEFAIHQAIGSGRQKKNVWRWKIIAEADNFYNFLSDKQYYSTANRSGGDYNIILLMIYFELIKK